MIVHNNRVYGLTTGQYTPTSPLGFRGKSTPGRNDRYPFNPLELMLAGGATYIARGYTKKMHSGAARSTRELPTRVLPLSMSSRSARVSLT